MLDPVFYMFESFERREMNFGCSCMGLLLIFFSKFVHVVVDCMYIGVLMLGDLCYSSLHMCVF